MKKRHLSFALIFGFLFTLSVGYLMKIWVYYFDKYETIYGNIGRNPTRFEYFNLELTKCFANWWFLILPIIFVGSYFVCRKSKMAGILGCILFILLFISYGYISYMRMAFNI